MELLYAKTILYSYANIDAVIEQIDEMVERKAYLSIWDFSPALSQYDAIINLTCKKQILEEVKMLIEKALGFFSDNELKFFEYKYFKRKSKEFFDGFDANSRAYFRGQLSLAKKFARVIERIGINEVYFEKYLLRIDFFKQLLVRVRDHETLSRKNKTIEEKDREKTIIFSKKECKRIVKKDIKDTSLKDGVN